jgi:hypothetical protein
MERRDGVGDDEVGTGQISHALRFTVSRSR